MYDCIFIKLCVYSFYTGRRDCGSRAPAAAADQPAAPERQLATGEQV